jgi:F0F1-type ATP synthase epsilon subunit
MIGIALIFASIMEVVASVSGFAFCKTSRDIQDEIEAEQRKRKHERHMAQVKAAMERNERRNALARQRRAELRTAPALHLVRS